MKTKKSAASKSATAPERGKVMNGAEILVECLEREGVDVIFAYPGGCSMPIHQALTKTKKIRTILPRHEQGGIFAAEGYARVTGRVGVCMATSGPGATNLVTGIADAFMAPFAIALDCHGAELTAAAEDYCQMLLRNMNVMEWLYEAQVELNGVRFAKAG